MPESRPPCIAAIDQGTTSTRTMIFDEAGAPVASHAVDLPQHYPQDGWVEHDAEEIFRHTVETLRAALKQADIAPKDLAGIGITNQRETTILWERKTGRPLARAIVWQDRRTARSCARLKEAGAEEMVRQRTGLLLDPYFSGTKLAWLLDNVPQARARAERGELAFGTVDSWLMFMLTGGRTHATDVTNASRTLLYDIREGRWSDELLALFDIPRSLLPEVRPSCADYGRLTGDILGAPVPLLGVAGDQQAATIGQACFRPGALKSTYGTGCFALVNTGRTAVLSNNRLLTTVAYDVGERAVYALEGSIFMAGAIVQWLRDQLGIIGTAAESADLAAAARGQEGVYMVPAFTGLGAPYWDPEARGALLGMTRDTGRADIVRAALDSVCYQTRDLMEAMNADMGAAGSPEILRVDGGMVANDWFLQRLADLTGRAVERPVVIETTALGAAYLAGLKAGLFGSLDEIAGKWRRDRLFEPGLGADLREALYGGWKAAVARVLT